MTLLTGHRVAALSIAAHRPLLRYLQSLGAELVDPPRSIGDLNGVSFLVDGVGLQHLADAGWAYDHIASAHPSLIHVSVSAFGSYGPHAGLHGSELVASAMSGTLRLTGEPDRPPVKEALDACTFHAEMVAAAGAMAAHFERLRSGRGQHVDVSIQEVAFNRNVSSILVWQFDQRKLSRVGGALNYGRATVRCIWPLADGWCFHTLMTGRFGAPANQGLSDWMDAAGVDNPLQGVDWLSYNRSTLDPETRRRWEVAIEAFFRTRTKHEIATEGRRRGINACVVAEPGDVLADPHLQARSFWQPRGVLSVPGRFATLTDGAPAPRRVIPGGKRPGPLSGVRVLDFAWALVGSITTKTLGDLGAEVIKVESRTRPCLSRLDVQVSASTAKSFDDKPWFAHLNSSKRSLALDMKRPEAMEILGPLIEWADVVVENFSPGTMAKLGLDYASLVKRNPSLVMVSGSVYGQTGPLAREWGVDGTGGALSGRTYLTGWPDRDPIVPGAVPYGDVIVPFVMAATVAAALTRRNETGSGVHIDASMYEICVQQMFDAIVATQNDGPPRRQGNDDPRVFKQGVWPTVGDERWIAITLVDRAQWSTLCALAGGEDIAAWTSTRNDYELMAELQNAGIAAGVVQDIEDVFSRDQGMSARGALVELEHPLLGAFGHVRTPIDFSRSDIAPFRAPGLGEHSAEVAAGIAGISSERITELNDLGVFK
ncbi:MAG: CoA transferase [Gammaproteobacteria bacterium]|nr:CoA transferase [Gammaproteobacteria bacterium]